MTLVPTERRAFLQALAHFRAAPSPDRAGLVMAFLDSPDANVAVVCIGLDRCLARGDHDGVRQWLADVDRYLADTEQGARAS